MYQKGKGKGDTRFSLFLIRFLLLRKAGLLSSTSNSSFIFSYHQGEGMTPDCEEQRGRLAISPSSTSGRSESQGLLLHGFLVYFWARVSRVGEQDRMNGLGDSGVSCRH